MLPHAPTVAWETGMRSQESETGPDERPPFWGSWNRIYVAVVLYTCALVLILYWITRAWNR